LLTAGCGGDGQKAAWQLAQDSAAAAAWNAAESGVLVRGIALRWGGGWMLERCQSVANRLVDSTAAQFSALAEPLMPKRGDSVFAELRVADSSRASLAVLSVRRITKPNVGGGCTEPRPNFLWRVSGGPPPWLVTVDSTRIVLTDRENPTGLPFAEVPPYWAGTSRVYKGFNRGAGERLIEVRISHAACRDSTTMMHTAYTAEVRRKSGTVLACAVAGMAEPASMKNLTR
jgi:uncharacterized membrane protein